MQTRKFINSFKQHLHFVKPLRIFEFQLKKFTFETFIFNGFWENNLVKNEIFKDKKVKIMNFQDQIEKSDESTFEKFNCRYFKKGLKCANF